MQDKRFYLTRGSRWRFEAPSRHDPRSARYERGDEFEVVSYSDSSGWILIHCDNPATQNLFPTGGQQKQYFGHPFITGAIRYSEVARRITMLEAGRGRVYFAKTADDHHLRDGDLILGSELTARIWATKSGVYNYLLSVKKLRNSLATDYIGVYGFDPQSERTYDVAMPEWKARVFRWANDITGMGNLGNLGDASSSKFMSKLYSMKEPPVFGEPDFWSDVPSLARNLGVYAIGKYLVFANEDEAVLKRMQSDRDLRLFTV